MGLPEDILIRGPSRTGDRVMASPGFRGLRAGFPTSGITRQVRPELASLAPAGRA